MALVQVVKGTPFPSPLSCYDSARAATATLQVMLTLCATSRSGVLLCTLVLLVLPPRAHPRLYACHTRQAREGRRTETPPPHCITQLSFLLFSFGLGA